MISPHTELQNAVARSADENVLRDICTTRLNKGESSESLLDEFEEIRRTLQLNEDYEDKLLDVMDALSGWCSPSHALYVSTT